MLKTLFGIVAGSIALCACGGSDPAPSGGTPTMPTRIAAVQQTALQNSECQEIYPFYFEIGDANGAITSASVGGGSYTATTTMNIASATKWLFGAYVTEVRLGVLTPSDVQATRMQSGYVSMSNFCGPAQTVAECFASLSNDTYTPGSVGLFHYGGGHFQRWGVDNGLADMDGGDVAAEFQRVLGTDIAITFNGPLLAGGAITSADAYAIFLRKILRGELRIANLLGDQKICTLPSACSSAEESPVPYAWSYSAGHWVEDDPLNGDGAFSSAGAFGFYPWIDQTKTHYGVIARLDGTGGAIASAQCGGLLRKAFAVGVAQ